MHKIMKTGVAASLLASVMLAGCSQQPPPPAKDGNSSSSAAAAAPGTFPLTKEKVTLNVLVNGSAQVDDYENNEFTKWFEEKTNVHIKWDVARGNNSDDKLNLMLASGDYPDVILNFNITPQQLMIYGSQGVFLSLNDRIEKQSMWFKKVLEEKPYVKEMITAPDGNIYALPQIEECYHCSLPQKMWINKTWLDKLGLKVPATTDEFYQVLKAFKEKDPNGNGKADEIPLTGSDKANQGFIDGFLMNPFVLNDTAGIVKNLYLDNGQIKTSFNQPGWKEGLLYMNKLFSEGLIASETFTQDTNQLKKLGENPGVEILGAVAAMHNQVFTNIQSNRWLNYVAVPPLKGPSGQSVTPYSPFGASKIGKFVITSSSKHPDIAFRWADALFNEEIMMRSVYGREGTEWKKANPGDVGINGKPAKWDTIVPEGTNGTFGWYQTMPFIRNGDFRLAQVAREPEKNLEVILYNETKNKYEPYRQKDQQVLPVLFLTKEQSAELADLEKAIRDYVKSSTARFIIGDVNINTGWDNYVATLEKMNVKRMLDIYQQAYDAKNKKK